MYLFAFYDIDTGTPICRGTARECAVALDINYDTVYRMSREEKRAEGRGWRVEIIQENSGKTVPPKPVNLKKRLQMETAAQEREQAEYIRRNGCTGCRYWGTLCGGTGCGYILQLRGCRKLNPDGSCASREPVRAGSRPEPA